MAREVKAANLRLRSARGESEENELAWGFGRLSRKIRWGVRARQRAWLHCPRIVPLAAADRALDAVVSSLDRSSLH